MMDVSMIVSYILAAIATLALLSGMFLIIRAAATEIWRSYLNRKVRISGMKGFAKYYRVLDVYIDKNDPSNVLVNYEGRISFQHTNSWFYDQDFNHFEILHSDEKPEDLLGGEFKATYFPQIKTISRWGAIHVRKDNVIRTGFK